MSFYTILNNAGKIDSQYLPSGTIGVTPTLNQVLTAGNSLGNQKITGYGQSELVMDINETALYNGDQLASLKIENTGTVAITNKVGQNLILLNLPTETLPSSNSILSIDANGNVSKLPAVANQTFNTQIGGVNLTLNYVVTNSIVSLNIPPLIGFNPGPASIATSTIALPVGVRPTENVYTSVMRMTDNSSGGIIQIYISITTTGFINFVRFDGLNFGSTYNTDSNSVTNTYKIV